ncbi:MAG TPA: hypothetical protein VH108_07910, partial [Gaiellaceae bacterium]|nr:hypothetical protein [Gaiellaceae bacterium]
LIGEHARSMQLRKVLDLIGRIRRRRLIRRLRLIVVGRLVLLTTLVPSSRCADCCANDEPSPS